MIGHKMDLEKIDEVSFSWQNLELLYFLYYLKFQSYFSSVFSYDQQTSTVMWNKEITNFFCMNDAGNLSPSFVESGNLLARTNLVNADPENKLLMNDNEFWMMMT